MALLEAPTSPASGSGWGKGAGSSHSAAIFRRLPSPTDGASSCLES